MIAIKTHQRRYIDRYAAAFRRDFGISSEEMFRGTVENAIADCGAFSRDIVKDADHFIRLCCDVDE
jgi:hypothetical protein